MQDNVGSCLVEESLVLSWISSWRGVKNVVWLRRGKQAGAMEGCKKTRLCELRKTSLMFSRYPPGLKLWLQVEISWREELKERERQVLEGKRGGTESWCLQWCVCCERVCWNTVAPSWAPPYWFEGYRPSHLSISSKNLQIYRKNEGYFTLPRYTVTLPPVSEVLRGKTKL